MENFKVNKWIKRFVLPGNVSDFLERCKKLKPELSNYRVSDWTLVISERELNKIWREQNEGLKNANN